MRPIRRLSVVLASIAAALCVACVSSGGSTSPAPGTSLELLNAAIGRGADGAAGDSAGRGYLIDPPDVLRIDVRGDDSLDGENVVVGPDGRIHRPLVGAVEVAGRTISAVAADLTRRYARYIRDVDVAVTVTDYRSKHVYVTGEVRRPGRYAYTGAEHVLDVIAEAGFLTRGAAADDVELSRGRPGYTERLPVRLADIVERGDASTNWLLEPGDVVHVPAGFMRRVSYAVQDVLSPLAVPVRVHDDD